MIPQAITIRSATQEDLIECLHFEKFDKQSRQTPFDATLMLAAISTGWVYLATHKSKVVGYLRIDFIWPTKEPLLVWMASDPDFLHQGINAALFKTVIARLKAHGFSHLLTSACRENIIALYKERGYPKIGSLTLEQQNQEVFFTVEL